MWGRHLCLALCPCPVCVRRSAPALWHVPPSCTLPILSRTRCAGRCVAWPRAGPLDQRWAPYQSHVLVHVVARVVSVVRSCVCRSCTARGAPISSRPSLSPPLAQYLYVGATASTFEKSVAGSVPPSCSASAAVPTCSSTWLWKSSPHAIILYADRPPKLSMALCTLAL